MQLKVQFFLCAYRVTDPARVFLCKSVQKNRQTSNSRHLLGSNLKVSNYVQKWVKYLKIKSFIQKWSESLSKEKSSFEKPFGELVLQRVRETKKTHCFIVSMAKSKNYVNQSWYNLLSLVKHLVRMRPWKLHQDEASLLVLILESWLQALVLLTI